MKFDKEQTVVLSVNLENFGGKRDNFYLYYDGSQCGISTKKDFIGIVEFPEVLYIDLNKFLRDKKKNVEKISQTQ